MIPFVIFMLALKAASGIYYDTYSGEVITEDEYLLRVAANTTFWCVLETEECDETEWRRLDGACNNLNMPARGAGHTPFYRIKPRVFENGSEPRLAASGDQLPPARKVRTEVLSTGRVPDTRFTNLVPHFFVFATDETNSVHDIINYVFQRDCCGPESADDWFCIPNTISDDDPVYKFSEHRCMNNTRQRTYQTEGCAVTDTEEPIRINSELPLFDLSQLYGDGRNESMVRLGSGGLYPYDEVNGEMWPHTVDNLCIMNNATLNETRCHVSPSIGSNFFVGQNVFFIFYLRNHNRIANFLAAINPCWTEEKLYYTARDINIASYLQVWYYECLATIFGRDNFVADGVLSDSESFRDIYDATLLPTMAEEYSLVSRWFHTTIEANLELYDREGVEVGAVHIQELVFRTGWYAVDDHLAQAIQGAFRQPAASITDHTIDPEIADDVLRHFQAISDAETNGLSKSRYLGIAPYVDYVSMCNHNITIESFDDLEDHFEPQMLEVLKNNYQDVRDIDLLAGIWAEKTVEGGWVPITLYCIAAQHLKRNIRSDRHWYERDSRPHAFTEAQLAEIRKSTISDLLCQVADGVTEIQPNSFYLISEDNPLTNCSEIPTIDLSAWTDDACIFFEEY